jgi:hypothetical protein
MISMLLGRALLTLVSLVFVAVFVFLFPRTFAEEPVKTVAFGIFWLVMLAVSIMSLVRARADLRRAQRIPGGRAMKWDIAEEAFRAGLGKDRPEGDRTVDTVFAMLWFALVEAGALQDREQAQQIRERRAAVESGVLSFAELGDRFRGGGDLYLDPFLPTFRRAIDEFVASEAFAAWLDDPTQFRADPGSSILSDATRCSPICAAAGCPLQQPTPRRLRKLRQDEAVRSNAGPAPKHRLRVPSGRALMRSQSGSSTRFVADLL